MDQEIHHKPNLHIYQHNIHQPLRKDPLHHLRKTRSHLQANRLAKQPPPKNETAMFLNHNGLSPHNRKSRRSGPRLHSSRTLPLPPSQRRKLLLLSRPPPSPLRNLLHRLQPIPHHPPTSNRRPNRPPRPKQHLQHLHNMVLGSLPHLPIHRHRLCPPKIHPFQSQPRPERGPCREFTSPR